MRGTPRLGRVLTCLAGSWRGFPAVHRTYQWLREHRVILHANRHTYHVVRRDVPKAQDMTDLIAYYNKLAAPIANRPLGYIGADINGRGSSDRP